MLISKYRSKRQSAVAYNTKSCAAQRLNTENLVFAYLVGLVGGMVGLHFHFQKMYNF